MKMSHKITPYLVLGVVITILMLVFSMTTILGIRDTASAIKQEEQAYQANTIRLEELRGIVEHEDEYRQSISVMQQLIPEYVDDSGLVKEINDLCKSLDVDVIEVGFGERVVNSNVRVLPLNLKFRCHYFSLIGLMREISSGERLIRIDEMTITQDGDGLNVNLTARTFHR